MNRPRVLLYCHNAVGLGHVMRTLRIARALIGHDCAVKLLTGCRWLDGVETPAGVEIDQLPAVRFDGVRFVAAEGDGDVFARRGERILQVLHAWRPQVVLADHLALGLGGELIPALRDESIPATFVWGVRDIFYHPDRPSLAPRPPRNPTMRAALARYGASVAYTTADWIDPFAAMSHYPLSTRRHHVGVIVGDEPAVKPETPPRIVCLAGSGGSSETHTRLWFEALAGMSRGVFRTRMVVGPFGDLENTRARGEELDVEVVPQMPAEAAVADAHVVLSQAGYNTAYALTRTPCPLVFLPAANDGAEQTYRAERMRTLDRVWTVDPESPDAVADLRQALTEALNAAVAPRTLPFVTDGATNAAALLTAWAREATA